MSGLKTCECGALWGSSIIHIISEMGLGNRIKNMEVPVGDKLITVCMGILNFFLPGIGTIIMGVVIENRDDIIIGALQLVLTICIVGWIWSVIWGVLMISRSL